MKFKSLGFICFFLFSMTTIGQTINADSLFVEVKKMAEEKKYVKAIETTLLLEKNVPNDKTFGIYLVSLYNWNNQPEKALEQLNKIANPNTNSLEIIDLYILTYQNLKDWNRVIQFSEKAIQNGESDKEKYQLIQAEAYIENNETEKAKQFLNSIPKENPKYGAAQYLLTLFNKKKKNAIAFGYLTTTFDKPETDTHHFFNLDYTRKWNKDALVARINYGSAFSKEGVAFEADFYKGLKKSYWYFNAGASDGNFVYPQFKVASEWYQETTKWSYSVGAKYLSFKDTDGVFIGTGHFGVKLPKEILVGYRPYFTFADSDMNITHAFFFKKSNESKESFWQIDLQYGTLPYYFLSNQVFSDLETYRVGVQGKFRVRENMFVQPIFLYEYQEYFPEEFRNVFNLQLILTCRF